MSPKAKNVTSVATDKLVMENKQTDNRDLNKGWFPEYKQKRSVTLCPAFAKVTSAITIQ